MQALCTAAACVSKESPATQDQYSHPHILADVAGLWELSGLIAEAVMGQEPVQSVSGSVRELLGGTM